jgi:hypothetical protein
VLVGSPEAEQRNAEAASAVRAALLAASERVQDALHTAESAAAAIVEEAGAEARRRLEAADLEAKDLVARRLVVLAEVVDEVTARAEAIDQEAEALRAAATNARIRMEDVEPEGDPQRVAEGAAARAEAVTTEAGAPPSARPASGGPAQGESRPRWTPGERLRRQETLASLRERFLRGSRGEACSEPGSLVLPRRGAAAGGEGAPREAVGPQPVRDSVAATGPASAGRAGLLAVQMAIAGSSDDDIERRLREEFDADQIDRALAEVRKLEGRS